MNQPDAIRSLDDHEAGAVRDRTRGRTATRADLLEAVVTSCPGLSRTVARDLFEATLQEIGDALAGGETVKLRSFGLFAVRSKRARVGRNPRTGAEAAITPRRVLTFKPSPVLLDAVNGRDPELCDD